jgi:hypothetical protein
MRQAPELAGWGNSERMQKHREQSQNVDENKAHHFFQGCKSGAFGGPIGANQALKGARAIWEKRGQAPASQGKVKQGQVVG